MPRREAPRQHLSISLNVKLGGEGGIRTHGTRVRRTADFESAPLWPLRYLSVPEKTF